MTRARESLAYVRHLPDAGTPLTTIVDAIERMEANARAVVADARVMADDLNAKAASERKRVLRGVGSIYTPEQIDAAKATVSP